MVDVVATEPARVPESRAYGSVNDSGSLTKRVARVEGCSVRSPRWDTSHVAWRLPLASARRGPRATPAEVSARRPPRTRHHHPRESARGAAARHPYHPKKFRHLKRRSSALVNRRHRASRGTGRRPRRTAPTAASKVALRPLHITRGSSLHQHSANLAHGGVLSKANEMERGSCVEEQASNATSMAKAKGPTASFTAEGDGTTDLGARPAAACDRPDLAHAILQSPPHYPHA